MDTTPTAPKTKTEHVIDRAKARLLQNYKQQPIVLARGEGVYLWDAEGRRYLDLIGGIATCALGHCHPQARRPCFSRSPFLREISPP